jgi:hypothetical protein
MPVRDKAEMDVLPMFAGELHRTMGQVVGAAGLTEDEFWDVSDFVSELFVAIFQAVDYNRVILEASGMCAEKQAADPDHKPKVEARYKHASLIEGHNPDFNLGVEFCADCFRLCILRIEKWRVMEDEDVAKTLPEDHAPEDFKLPLRLAKQFAWWCAKRKKVWDGPDDDH